MSKIENMSDCIGLKCELHGAENERLVKGNVFALFPLYRVHRRVHIVRKN